ncbi:MAG: hypothetical protein ACK56J_01565 [Planctomycetota bacterium]|jgi:ABC-2 type transport system permease protein
MNLGHLRTMLWLRWRLAVNQINKLTLISRILLWLVVGGAILAGISSFISVLGWSGWFLPKSWSVALPLVWDGVILVFLSSWMLGVLTDLQRTEPLSMDKFLHLPVSPRGVFLLNYFSSLLTLTAVAFLPLMLGLSVAMGRHYGGAVWGGVGLVICFLLMVTAVTFQFRGWLAQLMQDKRRRRFLVTIAALVLVALSQIPLLLDLTLFRSDARKKEQEAERQERAAISQRVEDGELEQELIAALEERIKRRRAAETERILRLADTANRYLPPLWLAGGIDALGRGQIWGGLAAGAGMLTIAGFSLRRSYRTTLCLYRGETGTLKPRGLNSDTTEGTASADSVVSSKPQANWLEWQLPRLNEPQSAVMLMTLRNMSRAPEAKLAVIAPVFAVFLLGGLMLFRDRAPTAEWIRPFLALGSSFLAMAGVSQLLQNQFGFDRDGFRSLLLSPVPEVDFLIGKNAATAPLAIGLALVALIFQQIALPLQWTHFIASLFQTGTLYLVACLVGNLMSIMTPLGIASGSLKPVNFKLGTIILQFLLFFLAPLAMIPAIAPLGLEWLSERFQLLPGVPFYLIGAAFYLVVLLLLYRPLIRRQADLLRERKWKILEAVTNVGG